MLTSKLHFCSYKCYVAGWKTELCSPYW